MITPFSSKIDNEEKDCDFILTSFIFSFLLTLFFLFLIRNNSLDYHLIIN